MLVLPSTEERVRLMVVDPGTNTLGLAVMDVDVGHKQLQVMYVDTLVAERDVRLRPSFQAIQEIHGDRHARLASHAQNVGRLLHFWQPHLMVAEEAFVGRNVSSFESLVECLMYLRMAAREYNPNMPFDTLSNRVAKQKVGAAHRGSTKEDVLIGVAKLVESNTLTLPVDVRLTDLSEHAVDALAIGYAYALAL